MNIIAIDMRMEEFSNTIFLNSKLKLPVDIKFNWVFMENKTLPGSNFKFNNYQHN